jgi:transcriptional regulator with XRE-family HTH domain
MQACQYLLINYRNRKNMSQRDFAEKCKVSRQYISLIESGRRMPMLDFVFNIADGFDMNLKDFMMVLIDRISYYNKF